MLLCKTGKIYEFGNLAELSLGRGWTQWIVENLWLYIFLEIFHLYP